MPTLLHHGCPLTYRIEGDGEPILFIQGVGVHGDAWRAQTSPLSRRYRCLSFDNRGIGGSRPTGSVRLDMSRLVDDARALVDAQGWDAFHVVGHSMGGHIAVALGVSTPERIRSLALLCTSLDGREMPPITPSFLSTSLRSRIGRRRSRRRAFLEIVLPRGLRATEDMDGWAARLEPVFGHDLADTPPVAMRQIRAYRRHEGTPGIQALRGIPSLVVSATEDPLAPPRLGRRLAAALPASRFVEIPDAAHGVTITHAHAVNELLESHLAAAG